MIQPKNIKFKKYKLSVVICASVLLLLIVGYVVIEALIGAGAVVTRSVPAYALMKGVPARRVGWVCECGEVLKEDLACSKCGRKYAITKEGIEEIK